MEPGSSNPTDVQQVAIYYEAPNIATVSEDVDALQMNGLMAQHIKKKMAIETISRGPVAEADRGILPLV